MSAHLERGYVMNLSPAAIALVTVLITGYVFAVGLGTAAYFANEKNY